jgi:hypothetical protein
VRRRAFGVFSWLLLLLLPAGAQAEYQRPTPEEGDRPTGADLLIYDGASRTIIVQLLNLTPYEIEFSKEPGVTWSITSQNETDMQDYWGIRNKKSFMFTPVGIPVRIPAAPDQNFETPYQADGVTPNPEYDPFYTDTTTHPYPMLFSWDDQGGFVMDNWVRWNVKDVKYTWCDETDSYNPVCEYRYQDVGLGLWMYRNKSTEGLRSGYLLPFVKQSLKLVFQTVKLAVEIENPVAWMKEFLAIEKWEDSLSDFAKGNTQENDGNKMWVASYVIPHPDSLCVLSESECTPSTMLPSNSGNDDAVYSLWPATFAGPSPDYKHGPSNAAEAQLVVSVHIFRGQRAKQCDPLLYPNKCPLGSESVVMITVMRQNDFTIAALAATAPEYSHGRGVGGDKGRLFLLQAGAGRIWPLLKKHESHGLDVLRSIVYGLDPVQEETLLQIIHDMGSGRRPTLHERELVRWIAGELQARLK